MRNCDEVLKFHTLGGGTSLVMALENRQTNRSACLEQFIILDSLGIFKKNSMSLGLVVLEEKLFTQTCTKTRTRTPQSDAIM